MKPKSFSLSARSARVVLKEKALFWGSLKFVLPAIILIGIAQQSAMAAGFGWAEFAAAPFTMFFYGCFALTWHRHSLIGLDADNLVNPLRVGKTEIRFILLFAAITLGFSLVLAGIIYPLQSIVPKYFPDYDVAYGIAALILIVVAMIIYIRVSFLLPANSVGVRLSYKDLMRASRGMVAPIIGANLILIMVFAVVVIVYMFAVGTAITLATGNVELDKVATIIISTITAIPVHIAAFALVASYIFVLSKAYQWGVQNNPV